MWPNLEPGLTRAIDLLHRSVPALNLPMEAIAQFLVVIAPIVLLAVWVRRDGYRAALVGLVGAALAFAANQVIGAVWDRPRPFVFYHFTPLLQHARDASFPSDHLAVLGAVTLAMLIYSRPLGMWLAAAALLTAFARVYVGLHYVSDVVDGFCLGALCSALAWALFGLLAAPLTALDQRLQRLKLRPILFG